MQIIKAIPKDIHMLVDISLKEFQYLDIILNNMVFNYDGSDGLHVEAKEYLEKQLSPMVADTIKELENGA